MKALLFLLLLLPSVYGQFNSKEMEKSQIEISTNGINKLYFFPVVDEHITPNCTIGVIYINDEWMLLNEIILKTERKILSKKKISYEQLALNNQKIETAIFEFSKEEFESLASINSLVIKLTGKKNEYEFSINTQLSSRIQELLKKVKDIVTIR